MGRCSQNAYLGMHESLSDLFEVKKNAGDWVTLYRGEYFDLDPEKNSPKLVESPAAGPLESLGFNTGEVARLLLRYDLAMVQEWTDITLAARERNGDSFFKKNAKAYLRDNLKAASKGQRTAPDWWASMRREEEKSSVTIKSCSAILAYSCLRRLSKKTYWVREERDTPSCLQQRLTNSYDLV